MLEDFIFVIIFFSKTKKGKVYFLQVLKSSKTSLICLLHRWDMRGSGYQGHFFTLLAAKYRAFCSLYYNVI